jgi:hypothetical protein
MFTVEVEDTAMVEPTVLGEVQLPLYLREEEVVFGDYQ